MRQKRHDIDKITMGRILICIVMVLVCNVSLSQEKRALLVGISDYNQAVQVPWNNIHGANDVALLLPTLKKQGFRTITLRNESATAQNIRKNLKSLAETCHQGDTVFLHFSCHGQPFEDMDGDEADGWDESLVPYDAEKV